MLYDIRDEETHFTGNRIERVFIESGIVETLYQSPGDSCCGVPTCCPCDDRYVFIHGPENQTEDWKYNAWHRHGVLGQLANPKIVSTLDARDIVPPYTQGALRGGTHLHTFSPDGKMIASTYEDHVLAASIDGTKQANRRTVAISVLGTSVTVPATHPRNQNGESFTVVVTDVVENPISGSDDIYRAYSESWIDCKSLAFQGDVCGTQGKQHSELFIATLPSDLTRTSGGPLQGTPTSRPVAPHRVAIRRLTRTDNELQPGLAGPRHWAVASPDGKWIGCFRYDNNRNSQFFVVNVENGETRQISSHDFSATSAFTWHPDSQSVAYAGDGSILRVMLEGREVIRVTPRIDLASGPTHHACIFSPDGSKIAYLQPVESNRSRHLQIFCAFEST